MAAPPGRLSRPELQTPSPASVVRTPLRASRWVPQAPFGVPPTEGGANWPMLSLPADVFQNGFTSISCPSTTTCLAHESGGIVVTTDGGATWSTKPPVDAWGIGCPSVTTCYTAGLFGGTIEKTGDAGNSWFSVTSTVTSEPLSRVKCPSPDTCFIVGNV